MDGFKILSVFLDKTSVDSRISNTHIGLYVILLQMLSRQGFQGPLVIFSKTAMKAAKISSSATYHKLVRELHEYGYVVYRPSFNKAKGSQFFIN